MADARASLATAAPPAASPSAPLRAPFVVIDDFLPLELAQAMRKDLEEHFRSPYSHKPNTHQVWNYWYAPPLYTYLRTNPDKVIARARVDALMGAIGSWSRETLGMGIVDWPYVSLYVSGCAQGLHNDAANGRFAFVYSLTPDVRKTSGGETVIFREGDPFRNNLGRAAAGTSFYELVPPRFNRLVVFDDRMPHAVERVDGSMDPVEGRIVLHGHIRDGGPIVTGALAPEAVVPTAGSAVQSFAAEELDGARVGLLRGPLVMRLLIGPAGKVTSCAALVDRVIQMDPRFPEPQAEIEKLTAALSRLVFPASAGVTSVTLPILFADEAQPPS